MAPRKAEGTDVTARASAPQGLEALVQLMPPTTLAQPARDVPWDETSRLIGFDFPEDYQQFIALYGSGSISNDLGISMTWLMNALSYLPERDGFGVYMVRVEKKSSLNQFHDTAPERWPFSFWPALNGLLPWARNRRYGYLFWLTTAPDPNAWTCAAWNQSEWRTYDCGMVDLLIRLVSGEDAYLREFIGEPTAAPAWCPNTQWPKVLPESLQIDDDDDWTIPAAARERGEPNNTWELLLKASRSREAVESLLRHGLSSLKDDAD